LAKTKLLVIALAGLLIGVVAAAVTRDYIFPTVGKVTAIELSIAWTNGTEITNINWGPCDNATVYEMEPMNITNLSNVAVTLELNTTNWVDIIALTLTWNYTTQVLETNDSIILALTQNVTAAGDYSYNTVIRGVET